MTVFKRHVLNHDMDPEEACEEMIEDNEIARHVITEIVNKHVAPGPVLLDLDDMNIRGKQIQIGYEVCGREIKAFCELVLARSKFLCDEINKQYTSHKAVTHGASNRKD